MKITFTNTQGKSCWINDEVHFSLIGLTGFHPPKANILLGSLPGVDGSLILHSKVEQRNIVLTLQILQDGENNRQKLNSLFKVNQSGQLKVELSHHSVSIQAWVESCETLAMNWPLRVMISLICPQPYFEAEQWSQLELASITPQFQFPLNLTLSGQSLGVLLLSTPVNAYNPGDIEIGFICRFECITSVENPKLINLNTGESIQLNIVMQAGQVIEINTEIGQKRIELLSGSDRLNLFNTLKIGSTFFRLKEKDNMILATSELGSSGLMTEILYRPKYSGV